MKRSTLNSVVFISLVVFAVGCRPKKLIVTAPPTGGQVEVKTDEKLQNLNLLKSKDLNFNTLSLKGRANLTMDGKENGVTMNIRIQKDKKIWVIVTAAGGIIEAARVLVTPDSLFLMNKLEKTYLKKPFSYLHRYTNKEVTFTLLQSILSGNTIGPFMVETSSLVQDNGVWVLSGNKESLVYRMLFNTLLKGAETTINDPKAGQALKVSYGNYTPVNNALFPSTLKINSMVGSKQINLAIEFNKIESNVAVDFPFSVPKNYDVIN